jgi:hypothetical protein
MEHRAGHSELRITWQIEIGMERQEVEHIMSSIMVGIIFNNQLHQQPAPHEMPKAAATSTSTSKTASTPITKSSKSKAKTTTTSVNAKADIDDIFGAGPSTAKLDVPTTVDESNAVISSKKKKKKKQQTNSNDATATTAATTSEAVTPSIPSSSTTIQPAHPIVQTVVDPSMTTRVKNGSTNFTGNAQSKPAVMKASMDEDEMAFMDSRGTGPRE